MLSSSSVMVLVALMASALVSARTPNKKGAHASDDSPLDRYLSEIKSREAGAGSVVSPGSLYHPGSRLSDAFRDVRAGQLDDIVTILVSDRASAVATGSTNTARKSAATTGVQSMLGPLKATGTLPNLVGTTGSQQLQGQGTTSRDSTLTTTLSARVTHVLPNGNLVVEGIKEIMVNSEKQWVSVRGIVRIQDLSAANTVASDRLANLEIKVNGKGVVNDSVRRPFILYRILLGLLPF